MTTTQLYVEYQEHGSSHTCEEWMTLFTRYDLFPDHDHCTQESRPCGSKSILFTAQYIHHVDYTNRTRQIQGKRKMYG
jgi:hypothetical protein